MGCRLWTYKRLGRSSPNVHPDGQENNGESLCRNSLGVYGQDLDEVLSDLVAESDALDSFTPLQLDAFHALWNLNPPCSKQTSTPDPVGPRKRAPLSRSEALIRFPIGTRAIRPCMVNNKTTNRVGQVYDFFSVFWCVRFDDDDWDELTF